MNTTFSFAERTLELMRYPSSSQHPSLQAFGSEDELMINHLLNEYNKSLGRTLILNDEFGALGCALNAAVSDDSVWQSDSYIGLCALKDNLLRNTLTQQFITQTSMEPLAGHFDTVVFRLPKSSGYLQHQLSQLLHCISCETHIVACAKVKNITTSILTQFESTLGKTHTSLATKKSRLVMCKLDASKQSDCASSIQDNHWSLDTQYGKKTLLLHNLPNVFSSKSLDLGARFMLKNLPAFNNENILDLGCGNGVLGLVALAQSNQCTLTFADESYMAVESAKLAVQSNLSESLPSVTFLVDNCLDSLKRTSEPTLFDRVLCNPPFHQQNTLTEHIAWQMFNDAKICMKKGAKLWVVGNRHLSYHEKLKRVFGSVNTLASNAKFVILESVKR